MRQGERREARREAIQRITTHYPNYGKPAVWEDYDRRMGTIPLADLETVIDRTLDGWDGLVPPKPGAFRATWQRLQEERASSAQEREANRLGTSPYPGGRSPNGEKWMTPAEARAALKRLKTEHPEAFGPPPRPEKGEQFREYNARRNVTLVHRIARLAFERVIERWEGTPVSRLRDPLDFQADFNDRDEEPLPW